MQAQTTSVVDPPDSLRSLLIAAHQIHALFPISFEIEGYKGLADPLAAVDALVHGLCTQTFVERLQFDRPVADLSSALWRPAEGRGVSLEDFYPHVRQILGGRIEGEHLCLPYTLEGTVLQQIKGGKPRLWRMTLGSAARNRCGQTTIDLQFDGARLFVFRTGIAILDLAWHYPASDPLPPAVVLEGNYLLSHGNLAGKRPSNATPDGLPPAQQISAQTLHDIAQALLPALPDAALYPRRCILYSLVRTDSEASSDALRKLSILLSHRQTSDYRPTDAWTAPSLLQPFDDICHALAVEGAASAIADSAKASGFTADFISSAGANTYVPLYISSLHTHFWLLDQTEWLPARQHHGSREEAESLVDLYSRVVEFRRYFYFPLISQISLHNAFYARSQDMLSIAQRLLYLEVTTHDVAELVKARRTKWIGRVSGAAAGFLVSHEMLDAISQSGLPGSMPDIRVWIARIINAPPFVVKPLRPDKCLTTVVSLPWLCSKSTIGLPIRASRGANMSCCRGPAPQHGALAGPERTPDGRVGAAAGMRIAC